MNQLRPMLAAKLKPEQDLEDLPYPLYASPKIDGIRALIVQGRFLSRTLKEIPSAYVQQTVGFHNLPNGLDGELGVGELTHPNLMQRSMSGIMSQVGSTDFTFNVFDLWTNPRQPYWRRWEQVQSIHRSLAQHCPQLKVVEQTYVTTPEELREYENCQLRAGYEGVVCRTPTSPYKFGRSTLRESYLVKLKRYTDGEARIVDFEELLHNANEATRDERGYAKRTTHASGKIPAGTLGALLCEDLETGGIVRLGTGFTAAERDHIWANRARYVGLCVTYKHFSVTGVKDARRQPVFKCFRDIADIV